MTAIPLTEVPANDTSSNTSSNDLIVYGSFLLGDSEFALPTSAIKEVVNEPPKYNSVPLAPDYLLGLFNLRGVIIPVVSLAKIFEISSQAVQDNALNELSDCRKVAIVEHGSVSLGLLFDSTGEVFNNFDVETYLFKEHEKSIKDQVIAGVFKLDDGKRIIQLLDVVSTLQLDRIPQTSNNKTIASQSIHRGARNQCISFVVGESVCALDIAAIREIVNIGEIQNTVLAGSLCLGAIDIRGKTVPIVNFSLLLGYDDSAGLDIKDTDSHRVVIMKVEGHLIGLLVNCIGNIISYYDDELMPFPAMGDSKTAIFNGCIACGDNGTHTIVLNDNEIFTNEEVRTITKGHSSLFKDAESKPRTENQAANDLKTLITFSLDHTYGLDIGEISEVIDYPGNLISTPSMATHIRGMVNLRGNLIAIIDTRELYALDAFTDYDSCKVLVFERAEEKYGLLVDTVDSIIPFRQSQSIAVPRTIFSKDTTQMEQDIRQAVMIESGDSKQTVCILDLNSIAHRLNGGDVTNDYKQCA